jgi:hypothetical protein
MRDEEKLALLHLVVIHKLAYWDALRKLEKALAPDGEFSDKANDAVIEEIGYLAAALDGPHQIHRITFGHICRLTPLAQL